MYDKIYDKYIVAYTGTEKGVNQNIEPSLSNFRSGISGDFNFFHFYFAVLFEFSSAK